MNCAEAEILICDSVDGTLAPEAKAELDRHLAACSACSELARDTAAALSFMERAADVEPPPELITRILFDPPWAHARAGRAAGVRFRLRSLFQSVLQPRFAMGMAMTILSFAMLAKFVKPVRQLSPQDLDPRAVWASLDNRVHLTWERTVKFYDSIRLVYQIRATVNEWQQQQDQETADEQSQQKTDDRRLPVGSAPAPVQKTESTGNTK
jgi:hypothetical protein